MSVSGDNKPMTKPLMIDRQAAATVVYHDLKESQRSTFQIAADYGKWLITSLVLIHGGALFGLFSFLDGLAGKPDALQSYVFPVWAFVSGLLLAFLAGFFVWLNWSMHSENYDRQARYDMLWDSDIWVGDRYWDKGITVTYWLPIIFGVLSATCIPVATVLILHGKWLSSLAG